ncbi:hypothetical protein OESDEN_23896 [Oesophagostomum dentatum]|uniref:Uncharacterized protein n=1 Tax=Oesophagostomum dentatum TaxID=61180 RepID=A0A0B1RUX9_OESDE|nr:hypothetical protein OESDEN_23896 [Oesophagostomum dentatum]
MSMEELRLGSSMDLANSRYYLSLGRTEESRHEALKAKQKQRLDLRADAFRTLQKALKDLHSYRYQPADPQSGQPFRWMPNNKHKRSNADDLHEQQVDEVVDFDGNAAQVAEFVELHA